MTSVNDQSNIQITASDASWPHQYRSERDEIIATLGSDLVCCEHIGSTAVPGLYAKPIIDMQAEVVTLRSPDHYADALASSGYALIDSGENDVRVAMHKRGTKNANLHIVVAGSWAAQRTILFRDALRLDHELAEEYQNLKRQLARNAHGLLEYTLSKTEFIEGVIRDRCAKLRIPYQPGNRR